MQDPALQLDALERAGAIRTFVDHATGATMTRQQLTAASEFCEKGTPSRCGAWTDSAARAETIEQVNELRDRGVGFMSLPEGLDTLISTGRMVFHISARSESSSAS